jgi:hypothetical protein
MPVIGFLSAGASGPLRHSVAVFHAGLKEAGYVEGQNVTIENRWAEGKYDRLPELTRELVRHQVLTFNLKGKFHVFPYWVTPRVTNRLEARTSEAAAGSAPQTAPPSLQLQQRCCWGRPPHLAEAGQR